LNWSKQVDANDRLIKELEKYKVEKQEIRCPRASHSQVHVIDFASAVQVPCYTKGKVPPELFPMEMEEYFEQKDVPSRIRYLVLVARY